MMILCLLRRYLHLRAMSISICDLRMNLKYYLRASKFHTLSKAIGSFPLHIIIVSAFCTSVIYIAKRNVMLFQKTVKNRKKRWDKKTTLKI